MNKSGWTMCRCGRRTRHAHGMCTLCLKSENLLAEPPIKKASILVDQLPGGCTLPRYVRPERRKECPRCHKTRDNLPHEWTFIRSEHVAETVDVCEWCYEELWLAAEGVPELKIFHSGCPCPSCSEVHSTIFL